MIRPTVIAMIITLLALAGCVDYRDIQSLENSCASLSNEVNYLQARMAAVEAACLQINTRLVDLQDRKNASAPPARSAAVTTTREPEQPTQVEHVTLLSDTKPADKLTRDSFNRLVGMTLSEVLTMLGKPDSVSEEEGNQSWSYRNLKLAKENGGVEHSPALIVFEGGCVVRATLTKGNR